MQSYGWGVTFCDDEGEVVITGPISPDVAGAMAFAFEWLGRHATAWDRHDIAHLESEAATLGVLRVARVERLRLDADGRSEETLAVIRMRWLPNRIRNEKETAHE